MAKCLIAKPDVSRLAAVELVTTMLGLSTRRLRLVAGTLNHAEAELRERGRLSELLNAQVPEHWPPPLNDEGSMRWFLRYCQENPDTIGWTMWYFVLLKGPEGHPELIGNGGFKGKPSPDGTVEVGYSIMESHQRQGYATEAVSGLLGWAFRHPEINRVIAETLPDLTPSIRLLEKLDFRFIGKGSEEGAVRYELFREAYEQDKDL
jgi:RimJ/RimL family protein N-acetyltransferase